MHRPVDYRSYYPSFDHRDPQNYSLPAFHPFSSADPYPTPGPTPTNAYYSTPFVQHPFSYPKQSHQSQDAVPIPVVPGMLANVLPVPAQRSAETQVVVPPSIERVKGSTGASTSSDAERDIQTVPLSSASAPTQRKAVETTKLSESSQPSAGPRLWKREIRQGMELLRTALEGCLPSEQINAASPNYRVAALGARLIKQQREELRQTKEELHQVKEELRILDDSLDHAWTQVKHFREHAKNLENHLESQGRHLDTRVRDTLIRNNHLREELEILESRLRKYQRRQAKGSDEAEVAEVDMSDDQSPHEG
ncbi:hypothetical protein HETIRDRAFT_442007 [Heterobasidion irregulare TC 32-1]|uniref:Uncharacterized protein n=1 Tax=Heterobasidion irregulare (strain TC 32-1) TaxID=747525 RepID=W4JSD5_HETIT|nr:uncharacterized protein HETIRDRAFT_442007 [Heterobasidion irregulare TC 32-1]ETW76477.1 hypothetical protein HETIRDRAFT_442007 [Heterobasidion irregulare TC 32-1]